MKLRTLKNKYDELNALVFAGVLTRPRMLNTRARHLYASYSIEAFEALMHFNLKHLRGIWEKVLYHEMIHQYVEEYLGIEEEDHHGDEFWRNYRIFNPGYELFVEL